MMLTYEQMLSVFRKGLRRRSWRRLSRIERAFFMASLFYARIKGRIVSTMISERLYDIIRKLTETPGLNVFRRGFKRALEILKECTLPWVAVLREWLKDTDFIMWLGTQ